MLNLIPKLIVPSVCELTPELLKEKNISLLLMDFDNTLLPYTEDTADETVLAWLTSVQEAGIRLCVLSNTKRDRAPAFCRAHGIDCITHARKPFQSGIRRCLSQYAAEGEVAALVGDQIYTDVLCANTAGLLSILVTPLHLHNVWLKLRHVLEKPWIAIGKRRLRSAET
ncbi:MAG: YqeG family HAD IIIA-type phosphatase [Oscillospiraceae bacterium]|nr:YqeG family HAD IIIA-type phosphatase [Oscillospiraceae bacterium]MBR2977034.1 YqeG family HAD IIIA-type phosphatase [Oscillospiraceae bacterium]